MNSRPYEPVSGVLSGSIECAAAPARSPLRLLAVEPGRRAGDRQQPREPETCHRERVPGQAPAKARGEWGAPRPRLAPAARRGGGTLPASSPKLAAVSCTEGTTAPGAPTVERVGEGHLGREQLDASRLQAPRSKEGRGRHQRVDRRANVVVKAWERQFGRAAASAGSRILRRPRQKDRRGARVSAAASPLGPEPITTASGGFMACLP